MNRQKRDETEPTFALRYPLCLYVSLLSNGNVGNQSTSSQRSIRRAELPCAGHLRGRFEVCFVIRSLLHSCNTIINGMFDYACDK